MPFFFTGSTCATLSFFAATALRMKLFGLPITGFYVLLIAICMWIVLEYLPFGRYLYAIGGNEQSAAMMGLNVGRTKVLVYALSGFCAALGGVSRAPVSGLSRGKA